MFVVMLVSHQTHWLDALVCQSRHVNETSIIQNEKIESHIIEATTNHNETIK
jgi:hypothetical protein